MGVPLTSPKPKAILFDLDDTILEFEVHAASSWRKTCEAAAGAMPGVSANQVLEAIAKSRAGFWLDPANSRRGRLDLAWARRHVVSDALLGLGVRDNALTERIASDYTAVRDAAVKPFEGALETLRWLQGLGIRLGLMTNGAAKGQRAKVERFALTRYFETIWVEGERGAGKPDPRVFEGVLKELGVQARDGWSVGDNLEWDIAPANRLGIHSVWVDWAAAGLPKASSIQPDRTIRTVAQLKEVGAGWA